ncbi:MAG TPA: hypothetical protein GX715_12035 [Armatimonadetes bacterium]|jgi:hypothetical protein|nr:hypothetical protein [Armatimonadota bacterium]
MRRRWFERGVGVSLALLWIAWGARAELGAASLPGYSIRRVVSQRPAMEGAFSPDGSRFVFVHRDRLWLHEGGRVRRIGAPAVDRVYRARWAAEHLLVVSHVIPGEGDALGVLDLRAGRYLRFAGRIHEDGFATSQRGGVVAWWRQPHPRPVAHSPRETSSVAGAWMAVLGEGVPSPVRLASGAHARLAVPSPDGRSILGLAYGEKLCLHRVPSGGARILTGGTEGAPMAAAWSPDGSAVACLFASGDAREEWRRLRVYRAGEDESATCPEITPGCVEIAWDAAGEGLFCRVVGEDPGLWHVAAIGGSEPRRVYAGRVLQFAPLAGGRALIVTPAREKPGLHQLYLVGMAGTEAQRVTNTPSFDHLDSASSDHRSVLITRRPRDDRQSLFPEATLWRFDLRGE